MELQKNKKIALISNNGTSVSETFIKAQIDLLPASIVLHTGWLPTKMEDRYILNIFKRYLNYIVKPIREQGIFSIENAIVKILHKHKIEAVLAQYGQGGCAMIGACKKANIPLYVHFHGFDASRKDILLEYSKKYKELFEDASGIIAVSKKMREALVDLGCPIKKILVVPCGPNDNYFNVNPTYTNKIFFGIGRFTDKKAPYLTLLAFKEVLKKHPDTKLIMGGDGELLNTCKNIAKAYDIEHNVSFLGKLTPVEIMKFMENALAFVQHSVVADSGDSEGTPVSVLEASASGLAVIATWHAGIPDVIINDDTGILVNEYDIYSMAEAMIRLIDNRDLAKRMGLAGRERIKNYFSMDIYISSLRNLINNN